MTPDVVIQAARRADQARIVDDLLEAFIDDPVLSWVFPDPAVRRRYGRHFFVMDARRLIPFGLCWQAPGGASLWATEATWRESWLDSLRLSVRCGPGVGRRAPTVVREMLALEAQHPREPHIYLRTIGVIAARRGQGLGAGLIHPGTDHADRLGLPSYLESSNPRNLTLYERHGFRTTGEHQITDGPLVTFMRRPARRD